MQKKKKKKFNKQNKKKQIILETEVIKRNKLWSLDAQSIVSRHSH